MILSSFRMPQSKAIHCYMLMSLWILLIIVGIYKFLETKKSPQEPENILSTSYTNLAIDAKTKRIFKICNFPEEIVTGDEGAIRENKWILKGLLILIRHGDRGPLQHIKKISSINCGTENSQLLSSYKAYLQNQSLSGKISWVGQGPFHGFPYLPIHPSQCHLGQLTMQGVSQLLNLGNLLKQKYLEVWSKVKSLKSSEVVIYSTRYRRTFQSVLAFLFGLIPVDTLEKLVMHESQSMSFCFKDCGCPVTEKLYKNVKKSISHQLHSHPAVAALAVSTGNSLFSINGEPVTANTDPHFVRDALLTFVCHRNGFPCDGPINCIRRQNVVGIFAYTDWVNYQKWRNVYWKRYCLLKSYGLVRHIVQQMLQMVSNSGPYLVVYSGHDHTLEQLSTALGLQNDPFLLRYAARIVFEVYQQNEGIDNTQGIYFRLLSNGKDITRQVSFCKNIVNVSTKVNLCKIEDIVRFLHDDYFSSLNVTNFKDACMR
ncbi:2-phosphoxylose phosphatase 1 [Diorhabda sublineata]|uniref:2-phosphoxylose phosphatase 1 n=1 Tax=Diorhabda sublineata TaxID=1163346 RepID=UPI0024E079B3|nr:2-phosphoxylose phosphatase 1 [Diorhabda sublineata]XP_056629624.1 2-phosphoxylose phosphatase 1 [Diorhabda sublineata]